MAAESVWLAPRGVESVIAEDEPLDLLAFVAGQLGRGVVEHADDLAGRGCDVHSRPGAVPQPGPWVGEQHHALDAVGRGAAPSVSRFTLIRRRTAEAGVGERGGWPAASLIGGVAGG